MSSEHFLFYFYRNLGYNTILMQVLNTDLIHIAGKLEISRLDGHGPS